MNETFLTVGFTLFLGGFFTWLFRRNSSSIEDATKIAHAATGLVEALEERIDGLMKRISAAEQQIFNMAAKLDRNQKTIKELQRDNSNMSALILRWRNGISKLLNQLKNLGFNPEWEPGTGELTNDNT